MAVKNKSKTEKRERRLAVNWRFVGMACVFSALLIGVVFGAQQAERFVIRDPRFALRGPAEYGEESPNLHVFGLHYASRRQVMGVFRQDIGRSLYLFPLEERRKTLLRIAWVKQASLQRFWPNQIAVHIAEREPVAFVQLRAEGISRWSLIDSDGFILEPPEKASFKLPVITGVGPGEPLALRASRVHRLLKLEEELGDLRDRVSDVDVADLDNLKVTTKIRSQGVVLILGDHGFRSRFQAFLDNFDQIEKRISGPTVLDLRMDGRITVVGGARP